MFAALISPGDYIGGLSGGQQTIVTPGTRVALTASETNCVGILIQAFTDNAASVMVGGEDVDASPGSRSGIELMPGQSLTLSVKDASIVHLDGVQAGDGVTYLLLK